MQSAREFKWVLGWFLGSVFVCSSEAARLSSGPPVEVYRLIGGQKTLLKRWQGEEWAKLKVQSINERNLRSGQSQEGSGFVVSQWIQKVTEGLSAPERAEIDLIEFEGSRGHAWVPWFLINRFRVSMTLGDGKRAPIGWSLTMPVRSQPEILLEGVPLAAMELEGVERVVLSRYSDRTAGLKLEKRSDPVALRGEKLFQQGCASCHGQTPNLILTSVSSMDPAVWQKRHPSVVWAELKDKEWRGLRAFATVWLSETKAKAAVGPTKPKE